jgi:hypothetical protein
VAQGDSKFRLALFVLVATPVLWLVVTGVGQLSGWPGRFLYLVDFATILGFIFVLILAFRLWRDRKD